MFGLGHWEIILILFDCFNRIWSWKTSKGG